jgi:uncharacterized protein with PIN domain
VELFELEEKEVKRIENIVIKIRQDKDKKFCPICNIQLNKIKDGNISKEINIEECSKCNGIRMKHGETIKYKVYQAKKNKPAK